DFSKEELDLLIDMDIFPDFSTDDYQYFTLPKTKKNESFLKEVENFDSDLQLGADYPLIVLEKTGIWYTNMPSLAQNFLVTRGITATDIENKSYHLWLVLNAMEELDSKQKAFKVIKNSDFKGLLMINDYFVHRPAHQKQNSGLRYFFR